MEKFSLPALENIFRENANPENAYYMKKYMKNKFDFLGIKTPERRTLTRSFLKDHYLPEINIVENIVRELWSMKEREFQYFAMELLEKMHNKLTKDKIYLLEYLVITKSWWDTVDLISSKLIGKLLLKYPELTGKMNGKWIESENIWLKRTALLFQLKYKENLDTKLLNKNILKCNRSKEFFIRKAIGWILREYSKTDPVWVKKYVDNTQLSPLSKREALKWLNK